MRISFTARVATGWTCGRGVHSRRRSDLRPRPLGAGSGSTWAVYRHAREALRLGRGYDLINNSTNRPPRSSQEYCSRRYGPACHCQLPHTASSSGAGNSPWKNSGSGGPARPGSPGGFHPATQPLAIALGLQRARPHLLSELRGPGLPSSTAVRSSPRRHHPKYFRLPIQYLLGLPAGGTMPTPTEWCSSARGCPARGRPTWFLRLLSSPPASRT